MHSRVQPALFRLCTVLAVVQAAYGCDVPVFRYALEHWPPVPYSAVILHREPLPAGLHAAATNFSTHGLHVDFVNQSAANPPPPALAPLIADITNAALPQLLLTHPADMDTAQLVWSAPFTLDAATLLIASPDRVETARRLLNGDSAVWLVLKGPSQQRNDAALDIVVRTLKQAEQELKLPHEVDPGDKEYSQSMAANIPLKLGFSVLAVPYGAAGGTLLRDMLKPLAGNADISTDTLVVPVFGRGRALAILRGDDINETAIVKACEFLVGPCSCTVKEMNPGTDIYLPVNWEEVVRGWVSISNALPPLVVPAIVPPTQAPTASVSASAPPPPASPLLPPSAAADNPPGNTASPLRFPLLLTGLAGLAIVAAGSWLAWRKASTR